MINVDIDSHSSRKPMVSVVMIAFNKDGYISDAIKGIVKQKFNHPFELLVLDDCSTDRTAEIAMEWQRKFPHIVRYVRNEQNLGLQRNYMKAFAMCQGRYVAVCDADDYWFYPRKLSKMVAYMEANKDCAIAFHRVVNFYEESGEKSFSNGGTPKVTDISKLSRSNYITNLSVMYRRSLVDLASLPEWIADDRSPDYAMHMLFARHGHIRFFRRPMGVYRKAAGSAWSVTQRFTQLKMSLAVREHLLGEFSSDPAVCNGLREAVKSIVTSMWLCASTPQEKEIAEAKARAYGLDVTSFAQKESEPQKQKPLLSRLRALVSKAIPLPRP